MRTRPISIQYLCIFGLVFLSGCLWTASATPTPSLNPQALNTAKLGEISPGATLSYLVSNASGSQVAQHQSNVLGTEPLGDYQAWKVLTSIDMAAGPGQQITSTAWVDQQTGVVLRSELKVVYAQPQANTFDGKQLQIKEFYNTRVFDLRDSTVEETQRAVDADGGEHQVINSGSADFRIFRLTRSVQVGNYYPWQTADYPHQVEKEQLVSTPFGEYQTWVIKRLVVPEQQYYLEFFDQTTGLLVKSENWAFQGDQWVMIEQTLLTDFQSGQ